MKCPLEQVSYQEILAVTLVASNESVSLALNRPTWSALLGSIVASAVSHWVSASAECQPDLKIVVVFRIVSF